MTDMQRSEYQVREIFQRNGQYVMCQVLNWDEGPPPKFIVCHPLNNGALAGDFVATQGMGTWVEVELVEVVRFANEAAQKPALG